MTEQEAAQLAEHLADRLRRVWGTKNAFSFNTDSPRIHFRGYFREAEIEVFYGKDGEPREFFLTWSLDDEFLRWMREERQVIESGQYLECKGKRYDEFAAEWLPFFRRNCWLSGCVIEATAHEKAEWIQGFTREELEAWNLKF